MPLHHRAERCGSTRAAKSALATASPSIQLEPGRLRRQYGNQRPESGGDVEERPTAGEVQAHHRQAQPGCGVGEQRGETEGHSALARASRRRGRRPGRGLGAVPVGLRGERDAAQHRCRAGRRRPPQAALRQRPEPARRRAGSSGRSGPRSAATSAFRLGLARLRLRARQGPQRDEARWPRRRRVEDRRLRQPQAPAHRLRHERRSTLRRTRPRPAFRGVLQGRSEAVWRGKHHRRPGGVVSRPTPSESRNLLLSKRAHRGRDPRPGDPGQRRPLHARGGDRADRRRPALLPALARV